MNIPIYLQQQLHGHSIGYMVVEGHMQRRLSALCRLGQESVGEVVDQLPQSFQVND